MMATWGKGGHGISACIPGMVFSIATDDSRDSIVIEIRQCTNYYLYNIGQNNE